MPVSPPLRADNIERLTSRVHDVLVVGAGINGAVSAAALAAGGAATALVDRGDFAGLTSQESSNLVWGGIKYLEQFEFPLVWKLCRSRNELIRSYPDSVREIRFYAPLERGKRGVLRSVPLLWAASWLYWIMGRGFTAPPRLLTPSRVAGEEPAVNAALVKGGIEYSDAYLPDNDARFVFGFVRTALERGCAVANYVRVLGCARDAQGVWHCRSLDAVGGVELEIRARVLVNAGGPYADELNATNGVSTTVRHVFSKGIHLVVDRIPSRDHVLTFFDENERLFFVIPMGSRSVVGTTDTRVERPQTTVTDEDRQFLFENLNRRLRLERPLEARDVIAERCGVRPLVVEDPAAAEGRAWTSLSRKHVVETDRELRCISIFGGKLTDCLNVGDDVFDRVRELGVHLRQPHDPWYGEPPAVERRRFLAEARRVELEAVPAVRLWRRYGTRAWDMLDAVGRDPRLARPAIEGARCLRCELPHVARHEMVVRLEDFLRRRTKIALVTPRDELRRAPGLRETCEQLAGARADELIAEYFA